MVKALAYAVNDRRVGKCDFDILILCRFDKILSVSFAYDARVLLKATCELLIIVLLPRVLLQGVYLTLSCFLIRTGYASRPTLLVVIIKVYFGIRTTFLVGLVRLLSI